MPHIKIRYIANRKKDGKSSTLFPVLLIHPKQEVEREKIKGSYNTRFYVRQGIQSCSLQDLARRWDGVCVCVYAACSLVLLEFLLLRPPYRRRLRRLKEETPKPIHSHATPRSHCDHSSVHMNLVLFRTGSTVCKWAPEGLGWAWAATFFSIFSLMSLASV